ncbi:DUF6234 family protein [Streptomyces sp. NPDC015220]|uniref:DUF6234 family protein n=1 Tax=Streptomyces sp. NPDC015220 TaxID=3364947 RepID=UPI0036FAC85F
MNLPIAAPAFDATAGRKRYDRADLGADIGAGCGLALLELIALAVIFGRWFLSGFNLDPAETVEADSLWGYLVAAAAVGALTIVAALIAARTGALVTVVSQGIMALLIAVLVLGGYMAQTHEDERDRTDVHACRDAPSALLCSG